MARIETDCMFSFGFGYVISPNLQAAIGFTKIVADLFFRNYDIFVPSKTKGISFPGLRNFELTPCQRNETVASSLLQHPNF